MITKLVVMPLVPPGYVSPCSGSGFDPAFSKVSHGDRRDWAELIVAYHDKVSPVRRADDTLFVIDAKGKVNGVLATDYATWTPFIEGRIGKLAADLRSRGMQPDSIWATGKAWKPP